MSDQLPEVPRVEDLQIDHNANNIVKAFGSAVDDCAELSFQALKNSDGASEAVEYIWNSRYSLNTRLLVLYELKSCARVAGLTKEM